MSETPSSVVERMLAERIGLDASSVGEALIARGVHARMSALGLRSKAEYDRALVERGDEVQALVEEVVVPESWFFRDDRPFEVLADFARAGWLSDPSSPPLSALSIPARRGRGALLDRDDAARGWATERTVPGRRRGCERPVGGPGDRRSLRAERIPRFGLTEPVALLPRARRGLHCRAFSTLERPVPPRQPARPGPVRRPSGLRRRLLPEPPDLPRRRGQDPEPLPLWAA